MYQSTTLPNGLRVVTARMPHMASVSLGVWVGVGGRHEPAPLSGISHFIEHLLFKGTRRRTAEEISQAVEGAGGYLNAFTDEEHTCFYARAAADRLPGLLDVLLDMYLHSRLDPAEIRRERTVIEEEMAMYRDQPAELVDDLLNAAEFPNHPLGRPVIGNEKTLATFRRAGFLRYLDSHYVAGATVIAAAGCVQHRDLVRLVRAQAHRFRPGEAPGFLPAPEPHGQSPVVRLRAKATEQTHLCLGLRTASYSDPRRYALRLLNVVLGENMSSRLFQVVREQHGLTYNIHSALTGWADTGDLVISAGLDADELERTLRLVVREIRRLVARPPGGGELTRARDYVLGQFALSLENTESHMMWLGEQWMNHGGLTLPAEITRQLAAVTPGAIHRAARDFFHPGRLTLALVGPRADAERLRRLVTW